MSATPLQHGEYHPRIYRGENSPHNIPHYKNEWSSTYYGHQNLLVDLADVFRYVEPHPKNWDTFSHKIRQLLVLTCNEVESQCKAILRANGYESLDRNNRSRDEKDWTLKDYSKLAGPMRLHEYEVEVFRYPDVPKIKPFEAWAPGSAAPLSWYAAYNKVKHDREQNFEHATLGHLITAICGVHALMVAQFGSGNIAFGESRQLWAKEPVFPPSDQYLSPFIAGIGPAWKPRPCHIP
jgi:hypothetical protein